MNYTTCLIVIPLKHRLYSIAIPLRCNFSRFLIHFKGTDFVKEMNAMFGCAPGRANIIGEHVDYNDGYIFPFAIERKTTVHIKRSPDSAFCIRSEGFGDFRIDPEDLEQQGDWADYFKGVFWVLRKHDRFPPFPVTLDIVSDVPIGAGLSSSASIEVATLAALNGFFRLGLNEKTLVDYAKEAENAFVGVQCGIMDQFASVMGKEGQAIFMDTRSGDYTYVPIELGEKTFLIVNSKVSHALGSGEYNRRRAECALCLDTVHRNSFRDFSVDELYEKRALLSPEAYYRGLHVLTEIERALLCKDALIGKDWPLVGRLLIQSHESLRDNYNVSCEEIEYLIERMIRFPAVLGARIMGGGFGGSIIALVESNAIPSILSELEESYFQQYHIKLEGYPVNPSEGARYVG